MSAIYYPILKMKRGELFALNALAENIKGDVFPILTMPPPPRNWEVEGRIAYKGSPSSHIIGSIEKINPLWDKPFAYDLNAYSALELSLAENSDQILSAVNECNGIPTVSLFSSDDILDFFGLVNSDEILLRIPFSRIDDDDRLESDISDALERMGKDIANTTLVLDFAEISNKSAAEVSRNARSFIPILDSMGPKQLVVSSCSFPDKDNLSEATRNSYNEYERKEPLIWSHLKSKFKSTSILFSDYATIGPSNIELDPKLMRLGAKIRYTAGDRWLFFKGESIKTGGYEQFKSICEDIVENEAYRDEEYSWGDKRIHDVAVGEESTGNQETWVRVSVNQHLTFVHEQIATILSS